MSSFTITVAFPAGSNEGKALYEGPGGPIEAVCWWDVSRIDDGTYAKCSRTTMSTTGLDSVHIAKAKVNGLEVNNRFIHKGSGPDNSLGCVAVETAKVELMLAAIGPADQRNVTVVLKTQ